MASPVNMGNVEEKPTRDRLMWKVSRMGSSLRYFALNGEPDNKALCVVKDAALLFENLETSIRTIATFYRDGVDELLDPCIKFGRGYCENRIRSILERIKMPGRGFIWEWDGEEITMIYPAAYWVEMIKEKLDLALKLACPYDGNLREWIMRYKKDLDEIEKAIDEEYEWISNFAKRVGVEFSAEKAREFAEILKKRIEYIV